MLIPFIPLTSLSHSVRDYMNLHHQSVDGCQGLTVANQTNLPSLICSITALLTGSPVPLKSIVPVTPSYLGIAASASRTALRSALPAAATALSKSPKES